MRYVTLVTSEETLIMRLSQLCLAIIIFAASPLWGGEVELNGHKFTLPNGFKLAVAVPSTLVERPVTADFDERGRLYVAEPSGSNDNVQKQLKDRPHRIVRLTDQDGDGCFDERTIFADKMMLPEGTLWYDGSLYVSAPPSIWKLTDTNDDGVADERTEWFQGKTLTGCANDLHGPYLGPDGFIYWCKGAFAEQRYERAGQPPLVTKASHIFRARPDGSRLEAVMTGGMDNPVDIAFTPGGDRIFTTTFLHNPADGKRDGLIHAIYGGVYGKIHDVINDHPQTGEVMPVLVHLGAAAPCGLTSYQSRMFGDDYQHNLFACQFNMHKVSRHVLTPSGATYDAKTSDFLAAESLDFHPTDVLEDADGSLLVVDTGGWYKLCCPTSQLAKPEVLGAIYRIRKAGSNAPQDARGQSIAWQQATAATLIGLCGDVRPAVRERATQQLAAQGEKVVAELQGAFQQSNSSAQRQQLLWTLTRIDHPSARTAIRGALSDKDPAVVQVALHATSLWRDREAASRLLELLDGQFSPHVRRVAAEALGRLGDAKAVPPLLAAAEIPGDRTLEHALAYALIEINAPGPTAAGLKAASPAAQRVAMIALGEMRDGKLEPEAVIPLLSGSDPVSKQTAAWILGRHSGWGDALASELQRRLTAPDLSASDKAALGQQLAQFASAPKVAALLASVVADAKAPSANRVAALQAMAQSGVRETPAAWWPALTLLLVSGEPELRNPALETVRRLPLGKQPPAELLTALRNLAYERELPTDVRVRAAATSLAGQTVADELFTLLQKQVRADADINLRTSAADALLSAKLNNPQLLALAKTIGDVGPLEINSLLAVFEQSSDAAVGMQLVASLRGSAVVSALRVDALRRALQKSPADAQSAANEIYQQLNADLDAQQANLEQVLAQLKPGDIKRGQAVFHSKKAACFACHAMGYLGGNVGPDLTHIGRIRATRDLVEAVLYPSASFVRSYEPLVVVLDNGTSHSGTVRQDTNRELVLAIGPDKEVRIAKDQIESLTPGRVSVMPAGLDKQLSPQELADLIEFLKAAK